MPATQPLVRVLAVLLHLRDGSSVDGLLTLPEDNPARLSSTDPPDRPKDPLDAVKDYLNTEASIRLTTSSGATHMIEAAQIHSAALSPEGDGEPRESIRFFDTARPPQHLWVRVYLVNGEVLEGTLDNAFSSFTQRFVSVHPIDAQLNSLSRLISHEAIAELQVISVRA